jgi:lipoprotein
MVKINRYSVLFLLGLISSCGYEGQQECEKMVSRNSAEYKKICKCMYEVSSKNNLSLVDFLEVISSKEKLKYIQSTAVLSAFGSNVSDETKKYFQTIQDVYLVCDLDNEK